MIPVEVVYGLPHVQRLLALMVPAGTTALEAVRLSAIAQEFPEIVPETASLGIFSRLLDGRSMPAPMEYIVQPNDRIEIYRPLLIDPKQARLRRAAKRRSAQTGNRGK